MDILYFLYAFSTAVDLQVHLFDRTGTLLFPTDLNYQSDVFTADPSLRTYIESHFDGRTAFMEDPALSEVRYCLFFDSNRLCVLGPCAMRPLTTPERHRYAEAHRLSDSLVLPVKDIRMLYHSLECVRYALTGERTQLDLVIRESGLQEYQQTASNAELTRKHFTEDLNSDPAEVQNATTFQMRPNRSDLPPKSEILSVYLDALHLFRNRDPHTLPFHTAIALSELKNRAVVSGVSETQAQDILDLYLARLSSGSEADLAGLYYSCMQQYETLIREKQQQDEPNYIRACKNILSRSVHRRITLPELAAQVGVSPGYLSTRFKQETGISLTEYACQCRLEGAANMLRYSDNSYADIAGYFCFSSQSRFIERFKKQYGCTPAVYRRKYHVC